MPRRKKGILDRIRDTANGVETVVEATQEFFDRMKESWQQEQGQTAPINGLEAQDCWTLLGLKPGSHRKEVEVRWRKIAHAYHPDAGAGDDTMFKILKAAYDEALDQIKEAGG